MPISLLRMSIRGSPGGYCRLSALRKVLTVVANAANAVTSTRGDRCFGVKRRFAGEGTNT